MKYVGDAAFRGSSLQSIQFIGPIESIGNYAFAMNSKLESVKFNEDVKILGSSAFAFCMNLRIVNFNKGLNQVKSMAFIHNVSLERVALPDNLEKLDFNSFGDCTALRSITLPATAKFSGDAILNCPNLQAIRLTRIDEPEAIYSEEGVLFSKNLELLYYPLTKADESYTLPTKIKVIANGAFSSNSCIKSVTCRSAIREIGSFAFENCLNLEEIILGKNVLHIGHQTFKGCELLTVYTDPGSTTEKSLQKYNEFAEEKDEQGVRFAPTASKPRRRLKKAVEPIATPIVDDGKPDNETGFSITQGQMRSAIEDWSSGVQGAAQPPDGQRAIVDFAFSMVIPVHYEYTLTLQDFVMGAYRHENVLVAVSRGSDINEPHLSPNQIQIRPLMRAGRNSYTDIKSKEGPDYIENILGQLTQNGKLPWKILVDKPDLLIGFHEHSYFAKMHFIAGIFCNKGMYNCTFAFEKGTKAENEEKVKKILLSIQTYDRSAQASSNKPKSAKAGKGRVLVDNNWSIAIPKGFKASVDPDVIGNSSGTRVLTMVPEDMDLENAFAGEESVSAVRLPISLASEDSLHSSKGREMVDFASELIATGAASSWEILIKRENIIVGYCEGPDFGPHRFLAGVFTKRGMYYLQLFIPDKSKFLRDERAREILLTIRNIDDPEEMDEPASPSPSRKEKHSSKATKTSKASSAVKAKAGSGGETLVSLRRKIPEVKPQYSEESYDFAAKRMVQNWLMNTMLGVIEKAGFISVTDDFAVYELSSLDHERVLELFDPLEKPILPISGEAREMIKVLYDSSLSADEQSSLYAFPQQRKIAKFEMLEAFQSFAWCVHSYAHDSNISLDKLPIQTLLTICELIESREYVNYTENSYCPQLSRIMAYGNFFTEATLDSARTIRIMHDFELDEKKHGSLPELRKEIISLLGPVQTIHQHLLAQKQNGATLSIVPAVVLSVWCAFSLAVHKDFQMQRPVHKEKPAAPAEYTEEIELVGTGHDGRVAANETISIGESVTLKRNPDNPYDSNAIEVFDSTGQSLGHIPRHTAGYWAPALDSERKRILSAKVVKTVPLSQRSARAKNPITAIEVRFERD